MLKKIKALLWGVSLAIYLRFGLEATGWLFYEASFLLGIDVLYWGYSIFRGGAHALSMWSLQNLFCVGLGIFLAIWKLRKAAVNNKAVAGTTAASKKVRVK
jgi:predicted tellurium resistance membrane protein TerC